MAATGDGEASYSLDASKHNKGPLLEFLLAPQASSLTFEEVVYCVLVENRDKMESSLEHVGGWWAQLWVELDDLQWTHKDELNPTVWRWLKKKMELKWKDLKGLKDTISEYESSLRGCQEDDSSNSKVGDAMATTPVAGGTLSASATAESLISPLGDEQTHAMEVDNRAGYPTPVSPVSPKEDDLLMGGTVAGVERDMANLTVSSPRDTKDSDKGASI